MQADFHFYAAYALARAAGFAEDAAHTVAYASQHTDDAKYEHALEFTNGGRFQQVLTAHRFLDPNVVSKAVCYRIWLPFHFLPGGAGVDFYDRMATQANSVVAQSLIDCLLDSEPKPYLLHRLGITLHVLADTWSHQRFIGLMHPHNDVKRLKVDGMDAAGVKSWMNEIKTLIPIYLAPFLGHGQAGILPDEPHRIWHYVDHAGQRIQVSNPQRTLDAAQACYALLAKFLKMRPQLASSPPQPWPSLAGSYRVLFEIDDDLDGRIGKWKEAIGRGLMGFKAGPSDERVDYRDRDWFLKAVQVTLTDGKEQYERLEGFATSHWKYFHDAAAYHRFCVLHEILPAHGMICG